MDRPQHITSICAILPQAWSKWSLAGAFTAMVRLHTVVVVHGLSERRTMVNSRSRLAGSGVRQWKSHRSRQQQEICPRNRVRTCSELSGMEWRFYHICLSGPPYNFQFKL